VKKDGFYKALTADGVVIISPETTFIDSCVQIGAGTVIEPNNIIRGDSKIGRNVCLRAGNYIEDSVVGDGCEVLLSCLNNAKVGSNVHIGPFSHLRPDGVVGAECRIGNFVEIKKSVIGERTKIAHLSYVGDSRIGREVNIGCGVVTANYDGKHKHHTIIEDGAFIGSNVNLIAPVRIGAGAVVAAGSTITEDVSPKSLAIARVRQTNKEDYRK